MLKKVFVWILAAMLALSNVGCTSVPQPTMEELLAEVNAEHQEVEKGTINASQYVGDLVDQDLRWSYYPKENPAEYDSEKILTQQQAVEDVTYLFDAFHDCYGRMNILAVQKCLIRQRKQSRRNCKQKKH